MGRPSQRGMPTAPSAAHAKATAHLRASLTEHRPRARVALLLESCIRRHSHVAELAPQDAPPQVILQLIVPPDTAADLCWLQQRMLCFE